MALKWFGDQVLKKVQKAAAGGINATMSAASKHAKRNHPGWKNVTGTAEGSIRIVRFAKPQISPVGLWGSVDVNYVIWLELNRGSFLRNAADAEYLHLRKRIAALFAVGL